MPGHELKAVASVVAAAAAVSCVRAADFQGVMLLLMAGCCFGCMACAAACALKVGCSWVAQRAFALLLVCYDEASVGVVHEQGPLCCLQPSLPVRRTQPDNVLQVLDTLSSSGALSAVSICPHIAKFGSWCMPCMHCHLAHTG